MAQRKAPVDIVAAKFSPLDLGELIVGHLSTKGFCTIDVGVASSSISSALQESMGISAEGRLRRPPEEIVEGLLGSSGSAEIAELELDFDGATPATTGEGLRAIDQAMSRVAACSKPFFPQLGFESSDRTPALLHLTRTPETEPSPLTEAEASEWLFQFLKGAVLCVVPIGPDPGKLVLEPFEEDASVFQVDALPGIITVLRTDTLLASHQSQGTCFLLSCFLLDNRSLEDKRNIDVPLTPAVEKLTEWATARLDQLKTEEADDRKSDLPKQWLKTMNKQSFKGQHMAARGLGIRLPQTWDPDLFFGVEVWGVDYMRLVPAIRWDHEKQYEPHPEGWRIYKTFVRHMSCTEGIELFDNKMFSITPAESKVMDPQQRVVLECGYEALHSAGLRKGKIMNSLGGMYLGYSTSPSDYGYVERTTDSGAEGSFGATGGSAAITANRFSFCLGMKGPSLSVDAEDASGLVAVHQGCEALQMKGRGQVNTFSLSGGIKLNLAVFYWPQRQSAGLLSASGRCKTFDATADGYSFGDTCCNITLKHMTEVVDNQVIVKGVDEPMIGIVTASSVNNNGRNVNLNAPHGPSQQELMSQALRASCLSGFDLDGFETYGGGGLLSDAVEVSSAMRILRGREGDTEPLLCSCIKTTYGNGLHGGSAVSFVRTLFCNKLGVVPPILQLFQTNPHFDLVEDPVNFAQEAVEFTTRSSYMGSFSRGMAGTNACAFTWGVVDDERVQPAPKAPERERLVFWPGGGGSLESGTQPRKGYHIAGTFTQWDPEPMEMERTGVYAFEFTLSENRWEQFQIWLDGDPKRCLHPEGPKASRLTKVFGPDPTPEGHTWFVEGRTDAATREEAEALALANAAQVGGIDRGLVGARYRIRLYATGKYRMVDWERLTGRPEEESAVALVGDAAQALPKSTYFVSGDWNGWGLEPMQEQGTSGTFTLDVHLLRLGGHFQIIRNRDWEQVFYPLVNPANGESDNVGGPDDQSLDRAWYLNGRRGYTYQIELVRTVESGLDSRRVSWRKTGEQELSEEQKETAKRTRYAVVGTWSGFSRMREMKWNGSFFYFFVELGPDAREEFQLVEEFDTDKVFYPADAAGGSGSTVAGPTRGDAVQGRSWVIGKDGYEKSGDIYEVKVHPRARYYGQTLHKVEWAKLSGNRDIQPEMDEGLVMRSRR